MQHLQEAWPFLFGYLTLRVPEELITRILTGMSERLQAPVVLLERNPSQNRGPVCFHYAVRSTNKFYRYPKFCQYFQEAVTGGQESCRQNGSFRFLKMAENIPNSTHTDHCHMGLTICMEPIEVNGQLLAICTSGKFIRPGEEYLIEQKIEKLEKERIITIDQKQKLLEYSQLDDIRNNYDTFQKDFLDEIQLLKDFLDHYLVTYRVDKENECTDITTRMLYQLGDEPDYLRKGLDKTLSYLREFLAVRYLALFMGVKKGDPVLPLVSQDGLNWAKVNAVHFNWRKAGMPPLRTGEFNTSDWLRDFQYVQNFPKDFFDKGLKGTGKEMFWPASYLLPVGAQYRGVLLMGECENQNCNGFSAGAQLCGKGFVESIGHLLVSIAISKRAMHASIQNDKRRDLIVSLTAHSIRAALHRLWDAMESLKYFSQKPGHESLVRGAGEKMEELIRSMKKSVDLAMAAPQTAVIPEMHKSDMEIEYINIAALLHNCINLLNSQAVSKQITFNVDIEIDLLPLIQGDRYMLELILSNILDNAIKYSKVGRQIYITTKYNIPGEIEIVVKDYGWGIPFSDLEMIFEPHYRSDISQLKYSPRGVGLGAYQAKQFIELHRGKIWADSKPRYSADDIKSHDVSFHIRLPIKHKKR